MTAPSILSDSVADEALEDWSFAHLKTVDTLWGPHGYHRYPAKFIPHLVRRLIERYSEPDSLVGDPFVGSATTGVEAMRTNRRFWGADINPVALLISQAKCNCIEQKRLQEAWERVDAKLACVARVERRVLTDEEKACIKAIQLSKATVDKKILYWFPPTHIQPLEQILGIISDIEEADVRIFFLCAFSNILRRCSLWLSGSTKPQKDLTRKPIDPVEAFRLQARNMMRRNSLFVTDLKEHGIDPISLQKNTHLQLADAQNLPLENSVFDLLVTSPPYATCYEYLELHQLTQLWFEKHNLLSPVTLRHKCIGGKSVSTREQHTVFDPCSFTTGSNTANTALKKLHDTDPDSSEVRGQVKALYYYFQDMKTVLAESWRTVKEDKYMILIIGDSYKRGVTIPTSAALVEMAQTAGFELETKIVRKIPARVLVKTRDKNTGRFSSKAQSDTQVYPEEDILIFRRRKGASIPEGKHG